MKIHLIDGTYELFRNYFGAPPKLSSDGQEVGATIGLAKSLLALLGKPDTSHIACAFDHVIESFRNELYAGYKTSAGVPANLSSQFILAEQVVKALGIVVWPMIEFEADDALAAAALRYQDQPGVEQILLCSPDKDLAQCVQGNRIICLDRRREIILDESGVLQKFGVLPHSIPDWLALVGDAADGYPGVPGWGAKSAATLLRKYEHLEAIPSDFSIWGLPYNRAQRLAESFQLNQENVYLFRRLATLRRDVPIKENLPDLKWRGALPEIHMLCRQWQETELLKRITLWQD